VRGRSVNFVGWYKMRGGRPEEGIVSTHVKRGWRLAFDGVPAAALLLMAGAALSAAGDKIITAGGERFIVPVGSSLHYASADHEGGANFAGSFVLTGTAHYYYGGNGGGATLLVTPDKVSASRLPRWKDDRLPAMISFSAATPAMEAAIVPAPIRNKARRNTDKVAIGPVSVAIDQYRVLVDGCGVSEYSARLLSVQTAGPMRLVNVSADKELPDEDC